MCFRRRSVRARSGIEARADDTRTRDLVAKIAHRDTFIALEAERAFLAALDGSCRTPIAGYATIDGDALNFRGMILKPDGSEVHETTRQGRVADAVTLGADAGEELKRRGGSDFLHGRLIRAPVADAAETGGGADRKRAACART